MANIKENKRFHFTYKTTNLINGRYYLGMHSTNRIEDGYLGSGKRLYYELNKYGKDNFKFEILKQFDSREELVQAEINLITEQDLKNPNCLNLKQGGSGGFTKEASLRGSAKGNATHTARLKEDKEYLQNKVTQLTTGFLRKWETDEEYRQKSLKRLCFKGKTHRPETIEKMKESHKGAGKGDKNSQYGTCWITNEVENRKIKKESPTPEGWRLGRKLKKD